MAITRIDIQELLRNTIIQEIRAADFNTLKHYILDNLVDNKHIPAVTNTIITQLDQIRTQDETRIRNEFTNEACVLQAEADEKEQRADAVDAHQYQQMIRIASRELTGFRNESRIIRDRISTVNAAIKTDESAIDTIKDRIWELELQIQMVNNQYNHLTLRPVVVPPVIVVPSIVHHGMVHQTIVHHPVRPVVHDPISHHSVFVHRMDDYKAFHHRRHFNDRFNLYHNFYGGMNAALLLIERGKLLRQLEEYHIEQRSYERSLSENNSELSTLNSSAREIENKEREVRSDLEKMQQKEERTTERELRARARNVHQHNGAPDLNQLSPSARRMLDGRINRELQVLYTRHAEYKKVITDTGYGQFRVELAADNLAHLQGNEAPTLRRVEQLANKYVSDVERNTQLNKMLIQSERNVRILKVELDELKQQKVNGSNRAAGAASENVRLGQNNLKLQPEAEKATSKAKRALWIGLATVVLTGLFVVLLLTLPISLPSVFITGAVVAGMFAGGFLAVSAYQHHKKSAIENTIVENNNTIAKNNLLLTANGTQDTLTANIDKKSAEITQAETERTRAEGDLRRHNAQMKADWDTVQNLQPETYLPVNERGNQGFFVTPAGEQNNNNNNVPNYPPPSYLPK